jgi:molybdopterin-synthase adenylyltransferase
MDYGNLVLRNKDYVPSKVQDAIRGTRLLIAGCGIGSSFAETAVRLGFEKFILVDGDVIDAHNLNRQRYTHADIGRSKVAALADRIHQINPDADVEVHDTYLTPATAPVLVAKADFVFDTIDFLDLPALVGLHDAARDLGKPLITAWGVGWGALILYFPAGTRWSIRNVFHLPRAGPLDGHDYVSAFKAFATPLLPQADPDVIRAVENMMEHMMNGKPCPASQVGPGADCVGALAGTAVVSVLSGRKVAEAPDLIALDIRKVMRESLIDTCPAAVRLPLAV